MDKATRGPLITAFCSFLVGCGGGSGGGGSVTCETLEAASHDSSLQEEPQGCGELQGFPDRGFDGDLGTRVSATAPKDCDLFYGVEANGERVFPAGSKAGGFISRSGNVSDIMVTVSVFNENGLLVQSTSGELLTFEGVRGATAADEYVYYEPDFAYTGVGVSFSLPPDRSNVARTSIFELCGDGGRGQ